MPKIITQKKKSFPPYFRQYFLNGCKTPAEHALGVEWEKIGLYRKSGSAIRYSGDRGVLAIFKALERGYGWNPVLSSSGQPIALEKGAGKITLEPGGQIELSGQKSRYLAENFNELKQHLREIQTVSNPLGVIWLGLGAQPFSTQDKIEWVPKDRYDVMRQKLKSRGKKTFSMMKETASVQVSLDYSSSEDMIQKFRLAMALAPLLVAMLANSPLKSGKSGRLLSHRAEIWHHTDPSRTGIVWDVFKDWYSVDDYVRYAMRIPVLFVQRRGKWLAMPDLSFEYFMKRGAGSVSYEEGDWELHLSSIFTEARLKQYLEIRTMDCQSSSVGISGVALLKGIFYDSDALQKTWDLLKNLTIEERKRVWQAVPKSALQTPWKKKVKLLDVCREVLVIALEGLRRQGERVRYLEPLQSLLREGICPAQRLLRCYSKAVSLQDKIRQLERCAGV